MNTSDIDIELPEPAFTAGTKIGTTTGFFCRDSKIRKGDGAYTREQVIAAIEPYAKRIAELEAARIAYASEFAPDEDGDPDVGSIHENIRKLKAELEADRKQHDRMLAHEWIRPALGLSEDAPYRFDFYAQEIEKLRNDSDYRKRRGEPVGAVYWRNASPTVEWIGRPPDDGAHIYIAPQPAEPDRKTDWNNELSSWSEEDFIHIFHERPDLANRLRKMLAEPVKYKRLSGWTHSGIESLCISLDIQQEQSGGGSKACAVAASLLRGIAEQHFSEAREPL